VLHHGQASTKHVPERQVSELWRSLDLYLARYDSPFHASVLRLLTGMGYALTLAVASLLQALPERVRPARAASLIPAVYRLHVRNALRGSRGPGLRELVDEWNDAHAPCSATTARADLTDLAAPSGPAVPPSASH
jgi:hypothetical protein